jgi:DNA polymerase-3 subunit alpha
MGWSLPTTVTSSKLREVLEPHRDANGLPVAMRVQPQGVDCVLQLGDEWRVAPSDALKLSLEQVLGAREVAVEY